MASRVPPAVYDAVLRRDRGCTRCGATVVQFHHRRSRRVKDDHQHCRCNGISLCPACHAWAHANPTAARESGLIVSSYIGEPSSIPIKTIRGWVHHDCVGTRQQSPERGTA